MASHLWQRLHQARRYADLSQQDLAQLVGVSRGAVALWEAAEPEHRTRPTAEHCIAIAKAARVPIDWLLNDASELDAIWRLGLEQGPDGAQPVDVLPDLRQDGRLFVFAQTPEQVARKVKQINLEPPGTAYLILVGTRATVRAVETPTEALATVVKVLTGD